MGTTTLAKKSITGNRILDGIFFILSGIIAGKLIRRLLFRPSSESEGDLQAEEINCEEIQNLQGSNEELYTETENEISTIDRISKASVKVIDTFLIYHKVKVIVARTALLGCSEKKNIDAV